MPMNYEKHLDMKERENQGKTLHDAFLKDQTEQFTRNSRRKEVHNKLGAEKKGGRKLWKGDDPNIQTDHDEVGDYNFWGAT